MKSPLEKTPVYVAALFVATVVLNVLFTVYSDRSTRARIAEISAARHRDMQTMTLVKDSAMAKLDRILERLQDQADTNRKDINANSARIAREEKRPRNVKHSIF